MSSKRKHIPLYLLPFILCLSLLPSCTIKTDMGIGVAYAVDTPVYGRKSSCLLLKEGTEIVALDQNGNKISLGEVASVAHYEGVFFCKSAKGNTTHLVLNGAGAGVWADDDLFYDGYAGLGITEAPDDATLFPQTVNEDASLSYVPERMGYTNRQRVWVLPPQYLHDDYEEEKFTDGVALPLDWETRERLFLTENGESAPLCVHGTISCSKGFHDGMLRIKRKYSGSEENGVESVLYQFLTKDNQLLQQGRSYGNARNFSEGLTAVQKDGLWGFIDTSGDVVIEFQYSVAGDFYEGRAAVSDQQGNTFYIDKTGTCISHLFSGYEFTGEARNGLFKISLPTGGFGLVNENGVVVSERSADYEWHHNVWYAFLPDQGTGAAVVVLHNGTNLYSDNFFRFYGSVCIGETNGKDVLYRIETGKKLKAASSIGHFREGLASCRDGLSYGYIDKEGKWVISSISLLPANTELMWSEESEFCGGLALARYNGQNVMLYNPLIYKGSWAADEFDRALSLGLGDETMGESGLTTDQLLDLVADFQTFVQSHLEDGVFSTAPTFRAQEEYLAADSGTVTREELAVCLCRLAEDLGKPTKHYGGFYADQNAITYSSEVNYTASLALFDVENNTFDPQGSVSQRDAVILFLRFTEAML